MIISPGWNPTFSALLFGSTSEINTPFVSGANLNCFCVFVSIVVIFKPLKTLPLLA